MKISEYKNLTEFLRIVFEYIRDNYDRPSHGKIKSYEEMLDLILESEFTGFTCRRDLDEYSVDFMLNNDIEKEEVYMFFFGKGESYGDNSFEIDLQEKGADSYFMFCWNQEKLPPFLMDFADSEDRLTVSYADGSSENKVVDRMKYMDFKDFKSYLEKTRT